jgi:hypothetical protein
MALLSRLHTDFGSTLKCRRRDRLLTGLRAGIWQIRWLGYIGAVFKANLKSQAIIRIRNSDPAAEELNFIAIGQAPTGVQWLAVDLHRAIATNRLHERRAVEHIQQHVWSAARSGKPNSTITASTNPQWQTFCRYASFAVNISDNNIVISAQIASSQRTTTGPDSVSGATRNSSRTSR